MSAIEQHMWVVVAVIIVAVMGIVGWRGQS